MTRPGAHFSDAAVKAQDLAVAVFMAQAEMRDPERVARVSKRHQVLSEAALRYRQAREQWLSPLFEDSLSIAVNANGRRLIEPQV